MHALAEYILRGRFQAIFIALLFTLLPFLGWVGVVIMAFVTLRKGAAEGFLILAWIALPIIILSYVAGDARILLYDAVCGSLGVWLLAIVLRHTNSWLLVVQAAVFISVIVIITIHLVNPNIIQFWADNLLKVFVQLNDLVGNLLTQQQINLWISNTAKYGTGMQAAMLILGNLFNLALARWVQAMLFNPGGLKQELHNFRMDKASLLVTLLAIVAVPIGIAALIDCVPVLGLPALFAGFSLVHYYVELSRWAWFWLICFYALIMLVPYLLGVLMLAAIADVFFNFRQRFNVVKS